MELMIAAITLGIVSNLHCIGMCGPIALVLPIDRTGKWMRLFGVLSYNSGRIFSYVTLGGLFGLFGAGIRIAGLMQLTSIVLGISLLLYVFLNNGWFRKRGVVKWYDRLGTRMGNALGQLLTGTKNPPLFVIGGLNGLLPCGMTLTAAFASVPFGGVIQSMSFMLFFGLGTLPIMISLPIFSHMISSDQRIKFKKVVPIVIAVFGILFILRGLNLGIDYISPDLSKDRAPMEQCGELILD